MAPTAEVQPQAGWHGQAASYRCGLPAPLTSIRSSLPARKKGIRFASTLTIAPVLGLRPWRARRFLTPKLPKPRISIRFPPARTFDIASNIALTMVSDCRCEKFWWRASSSSMIPRLIMAREPGCALSIAAAPPRGATLAVLAVQTQFHVQQVFHREAGLFVLAAQVLLHLLALFVRLQGLDR